MIVDLYQHISIHMHFDIAAASPDLLSIPRYEVGTYLYIYPHQDHRNVRDMVRHTYGPAESLESHSATNEGDWMSPVS